MKASLDGERAPLPKEREVVASCGAISVVGATQRYVAESASSRVRNASNGRATTPLRSG